MKLDIERIQQIVNDGVDKKTAIELMKKIQQAAEEEKKDKVPRKKTKLLAVQLEDTESVYIVQSDAEFDEKQLIDVICTKIAVDFNCSKKGAKHPVLKLCDVFESVPTKFWKQYGLSIKTKEALDIYKSKNIIIPTK